MSSDLRALHQRGRAALQRGDVSQALQDLYAAAEKTSAREAEYRAVLSDLREAFVRQRLYRAALTVDWYTGESGNQTALLAHVPDVDRARTLQAWADAETKADGPRARESNARAADVYEGAGLIAHSAICREKGHDFATARALWSRLSQTLSSASEELYAAALARFNLARSCAELGEKAAAQTAVVASVHLLEEAADRYERIGQRERAFDCYQVLIAVGKNLGQFEHVLEGYVNVVRILREDHLRYYALQSYEEALEAALNEEEFAAGATLAQEMGVYAEAQGLTTVANHATRMQAQMWERVAQASIARGAPAEMPENAMLAAVVALARQGQFAEVGRLYQALAELDLEAARKAHYTRASRRYEGVGNQSVEAAPLPSHLRQEAAYPDVWHVDLIEWEQKGSASAVSGDVVLDAGNWSEITRRRAMLARLAALDVDAAQGRPTDETHVRLARLLGQVELYTILSPLEAMYATQSEPVRLAVVHTLEKFLYKRTFVTLRAALGDPATAVRGQAYQTLEKLRFPHAFDPLARIYRESDDHAARVAAVGAMARIDTGEAAELLLGVFQHEGQVERDAAAKALKSARGSAFLTVARAAMPTLSQSAQNEVRAIFQFRGEHL